MKLNEIQSPLLVSDIKSVSTIVNAVKKHFPDMTKVATHKYRTSINSELIDSIGSSPIHTYLLGKGPYTGKRAMYFLENLLGPPNSDHTSVFDQGNIIIKQITWTRHQVATYQKLNIRMSYPISEDETSFERSVYLHIIPISFHSRH